MKKFEAIGMGALNLDHMYRVESILDNGEAAVNEAGRFPGGSAANTVYCLAKLGIDSAFIGAIGDDSEGRLILDDFDRVGVDASQVVTKKGAKTGATLCLSDPSGERSIYVMPGANSLLNDKDIDFACINAARLIHLSSFVDDEQFRLSLNLAGKLSPSTILSFSPGELYVTRGLGALAPVLARTDILFINREEIEGLTGKGFKNGAEVCLEHGCRTVVVTLGKGERPGDGKALPVICYIRDAVGEYPIESAGMVGAAATDTTGAGDAFAAGFLYGTLNSKEPEVCGRLGDITARFCIAEFGARQGLPTPTRLAQRYYELYKERI